ncbi:MAG: hypothetical protein HOP16_16095 [Acidobacteria bacterium]|nr:hypothetical protein [Acidobacteriota bacterium]
MIYTSRERICFLAIAVLGFAGLNGVFVWALLARPEFVWSAMENPVAAVFIVEAFVMVGLLAYLLARWRLSTVHWGWFVFFSILGGLAFAVPVVLLWRGPRTHE